MGVKQSQDTPPLRAREVEPAIQEPPAEPPPPASPAPREQEAAPEPVSARKSSLSSLPPVIEIDCGRFQLAEVYKQQRLAAVGRYAGDSGQVVLKLYQFGSPLLRPFLWLARRMASREIAALRLLRGIRGLPAEVQPYQAYGLTYEYVAGRPLPSCSQIPQGFFVRLDELLRDIHGRGVAHVDLSKRHNIIVGDDDRPYLIDFQISWIWPPDSEGPRAPRLLPPFLGRSILRHFQRADRHHLEKHWRRFQPGTLDRGGLVPARPPSFSIRLHRFLTRPYHALRRRRKGR